MLERGWADRFAEFEGLVHGTAIPNGTLGLMIAAALFRGLRRPMIADGHDENILVYVTNPMQTYRYPDPRQMGAAPPAKEPPYPNAVFATYAEVSETAKRAQAIAAANGGTHLNPMGMVYDWEWVLASVDNPAFPSDFKTRYLERMW